MRWLVLAGSVLFAYLALIPGGLVVSTLDPACAGPDCDQPLAEDVLLGALYVLCFATIAACSATMALYFFRTTARGELYIRRSLVFALAAAGATLLAQFARAYPCAALFTVAVGGAVYGTLRYLNAPKPGPLPPDPSSNGHGKLNGHPG
jgi:hypothetical protein